MAAHESWNTISPEFRLSVQQLAAGPRAYVGRYLFHGVAEHGVEWETELVILTVVESGQSKLVEMFPGDDADAAFARFEEVGAETEPERVQARICRAANARDWAALRACFADDYLSVDHRALGWEPQQGADDTVVLYRSWVEIAPDFESHFDVLAGDDQHVAVRLDARGHAPMMWAAVSWNS